MTAPMPQPSRDELHKIYERCDVSNNRTDDPMSFEEFEAALHSHIEQVVREAQLKEVEDALFYHRNAKSEEWLRQRIAALTKEREDHARH